MGFVFGLVVVAEGKELGLVVLGELGMCWSG